MIKILQVTETIEDGKLLDNVYKSEELIKEIEHRFEKNNELNIDDFKFIDITFEKVRIALQKANEILKV